MKFFQVSQYLTMFLFCFSDVVAINMLQVLLLLLLMEGWSRALDRRLAIHCFRAI